MLEYGNTCTLQIQRYHIDFHIYDYIHCMLYRLLQIQLYSVTCCKNSRSFPCLCFLLIQCLQLGQNLPGRSIVCMCTEFDQMWQYPISDIVILVLVSVVIHIPTIPTQKHTRIFAFPIPSNSCIDPVRYRYRYRQHIGK